MWLTLTIFFLFVAVIALYRGCISCRHDVISWDDDDKVFKCGKCPKEFPKMGSPILRLPPDMG